MDPSGPNALNRLKAMKAKSREELALDPLYRQAGWTAAHARLLAILPNARETIPVPYNLLPDGVLEAAKDAGVPIESVLLFNPWRSNPEGRGAKAFKDYDRLELFDVVFAERPLTDGPLWFIPDDCFGSREPFLVHGEQLREFVASCPCYLNDDVLFIWCESPRVTVIHHEGAFFHIVM